MDNFMDKLAEKYSAQDMIRANSQAESAQMQSLQEQVEAYEAVLQEMRKLNYKNTELTEKMYALVDASIEKVRTLQIEAEGGVSTEVVSREMTETVTHAVSEAVSHMDESMIRSLTESVQTAMQQPAAEIRQSTEDVKNSVVAVQTSADDVRSSLDALRSDISDLKQQNAAMQQQSSSVEQQNDDLHQQNEEISDKLFALQQTGTGMEETLASVAAAVAALQQGGGSAAIPQDMMEELQLISAQLDELQSMDLQKISNKLEEQDGALQGISGKLDAMQESAVTRGGMEESSEEVRTDALQGLESKLEEQKAGLQGISEKLSEMQNSSAQQDALQGLESKLEEQKAGLQGISEKLSEMQSSAQQDALQGLESKLAEQKAGLQTIESKIEEQRDSLLGVEGKLGELKSSAVQELSAKIEEMHRDTLEGISGQLEVLLRHDEEDDSKAEAMEKISALIEELQQQSKIDALNQETLSALTQSNSQTQDSLTELKSVIRALNEDKSSKEAADLLMEALGKLQGESSETKAAVEAIQGADGQTREALESLKTTNQENRTALQDIFDVIQAMKKDAAEARAEQSRQPGGMDEELRQMLSELQSGHKEVSISLRNIKTANDENKNTLKSSLDSGIYGLKQDNKEIVEFMQRMNANLLKRNEEAEQAAQKEEEAQLRAEEDKKALEERFKVTEDFMHKESVKVYRNVQAVINEKTDKQKESVENANLSVEKRVSKVKALVVINMVFTLINLAAMILYIFGFLGGR